MRLADFLDKGASLGPEAPCLTTAGRTLSYFDVQRLSWRVARALDRSGIVPGDKVAILSANDPVAFSCVFGISRAGAVWCPVNPRNEAAENRDLLDFFDCTCLIFQAAFAPLVTKILPDLPKLTTLVCLDGEQAGAAPFEEWIGARGRRALAGRTTRRHRHAGRHRRHHRPPQGRDAHRPQHRDDVRADADELPVSPAPALPGPRAAHPRGRRAVLPGHDARRRDRHHARAGSDRVPGPGRAAQDHPHVPAADADLHAPRPRPARPAPTPLTCSACGTARPRCRPAAWRRP